MTKKDIASKVKTAKLRHISANVFYHEYTDKTGYRYSLRTYRLSEREDQIEGSDGYCYGYCENKKEFIQWLFEHLN